MNGKKTSNVLVIALALIAAIVFIGLVAEKNMWAWIVTYWAVLTIKNILDYFRLR